MRECRLGKIQELESAGTSFRPNPGAGMLANQVGKVFF